jgi:hypothetical protein
MGLCGPNRVDCKTIKYIRRKQMGRPLNKKYFGNRNIGTTGTADDGIGGQGIASVTIAGTNNNYIAVPTATFAAPTLPGGVTATAGAITMIVKSVSITNGGGSYIDEEVVTLGDGSAAGGTGTVDGTYTTRASFRIKSVDGGGAATTIELVAGGSYTVLAYNGSTHASAAGSTITEMYTTGGTGNNLRIAITWGVLAVAVSNKGSGYVTAPVITMTGNASKTAVLTTDTGGVPGSSTNQENAIQILAWIPTADGGSSSVIGDIVAQKGSRRMKVKTAQGTGVVTLVAAVVAAGQGTIIATDANDSTYWVTKLTSKKALLTQKVMNGSFEFASNSTAQWSFDAAELGIVQIANA